jgi:signal transduction histidine kinase
MGLQDLGHILLKVGWNMTICLCCDDLVTCSTPGLCVWREEQCREDAEDCGKSKRNQQQLLEIAELDASDEAAAQAHSALVPFLTGKVDVEFLGNLIPRKRDALSSISACLGEIEQWLRGVSGAQRSSLNGGGQFTSDADAVFHLRQVLVACRADVEALSNYALTEGRVVQSVLENLGMTFKQFDEIVRGGELSAQDLALNDLIEAALSDEWIKNYIARKDIHVVRNLTPKLPPFRAFRKLVHFAFRTAITNALEAVDDGGTVTVSTRGGPTAELVGEHSGLSILTPFALRVDFEDTGPGIPKSVRQNLFRQKVGSTKTGGHGLGLYYSAKFIGRCNGTIGVEAPRARGSLLWMAFPTCQAS